MKSHHMGLTTNLTSEIPMLLATLALAIAQPAAPLAQPVFHSAQVPCGPDSSKSIACNANRHQPARKTAMNVPMVCNSDPLKGAACHAHVAHARTEKRSEEQLASAAD